MKRTRAQAVGCLSVGRGSSHDPGISELSSHRDTVPGSLPWTAGIKSPRVLNLQAVCLERFVEAVGAGSPGPQETTSWAAQKPGAGIAPVEACLFSEGI